MNINPKIKEILLKFNIDYTDGVLGLLSIYFNLDDNHRIPELTIKQINLTKIVERDYEAPGNLKWNIPLFEGQIIVDTNWDWIEQFRAEFGKIRNDAIGNKQDCYSKMKKFFSKNPHIRKEDVYKATMMYINDFRSKKTNPKYLQRADYFISKLVKGDGGQEFNSRLEMYLEIIEKNKIGIDQEARQLKQVMK